MSDSAAADIVDLALRPKPELIIHRGSLPDTAEALRDLLAASGRLFDRGVPVRDHKACRRRPAVSDPAYAAQCCHGGASALPAGEGRPEEASYIPVTLPDRVAQMYLDMFGEWGLPPLAGISTAPLLSADGSVRMADGYDPATALWCRSVPTLRLPSQPSRADAEAGAAATAPGVPHVSICRRGAVLGHLTRC